MSHESSLVHGKYRQTGLFSTPPISVTLLTADVIHGFWFSDVPQTISCYWYPQLFRMKRVTGDKVRRQEPWLRYNVEGLTVGVSGLCVAEEMIGRLLVFGFGFGGGVVVRTMYMEVWSIRGHDSEWQDEAQQLVL